jgi:mycothiol synthase
MLTPPPGFSSRAPTETDVEPVLALIRASEEADEGNAEMTADDVLATWQRPRFDLSEDAVVVVSAEGGPAAYIDVWDRDSGTRFSADGYVHPGNRGRGLGTYLVRWAEARAREKGAEHGAAISHTIYYGDEAGHRLFIAEGYALAQHYWRMLMQMPGPPRSPESPEGVRIRSFQPGQDDEQVWQVVQDGFADNHEYTPLSFDDWRSFMLRDGAYDPSLYFLAETEDGTIAGVALCPKSEDIGWVRQLAVRRDARGRGVGRALMRTAFAEHYRRGYPAVGLVVDSFNRTGAKRFYELLGMTVERQHDRYEKPLSS